MTTIPHVDVLAGVVQAFLEEELIVLVDRSVAVEIPAAVDRDDAVADVIDLRLRVQLIRACLPHKKWIAEWIHVLRDAGINLDSVNEPGVG